MQINGENAMPQSPPEELALMFSQNDQSPFVGENASALHRHLYPLGFPAAQWFIGCHRSLAA